MLEIKTDVKGRKDRVIRHFFLINLVCSWSQMMKLRIHKKTENWGVGEFPI